MEEDLELKSVVDEMKRLSNDYEIVYPDSITDLYCYCNRLELPAGTCVTDEGTAGVVWAAVWMKVYNGLKCSYSDAEALASEFMNELIYNGTCPDEIDRSGILIQRAKKLAMSHVDPCGKEINEVLHAALLQLVAEGVLQRTDEAKCISSGTLFWLCGRKSKRVATSDECESMFNVLPKVGKKVLDESTEGKRMLTPSDAKSLIVGLLKVLGEDYAVTASDFMACLKNRTRNIVVEFVPYQEIQGKDDEENDDNDDDYDLRRKDVGEGSDRDILGKDASNALSYREYWLEHQSNQLAADIWEKVSWIPDGIKVLMRYTLPEMYRKDMKKHPVWEDGKKCDTDVSKTITASDFGDARKVAYIHEKVCKILRQRLGEALNRPNEFDFSGWDLASETIKRILEKCSENGFDVILK